MQSLHYNNGSIKLTRERSTMVSRWEADEVARWVSGKDRSERGIHPRYSSSRSRWNSIGCQWSLLQTSNHWCCLESFNSWRSHSNGNSQIRSTNHSHAIDRSSSDIGKKNDEERWTFARSRRHRLFQVDRLNSETLALLIMRIHSAANTSWNFFKRNDEKDGDTENSNWIKSPSFYTSISHLSDAIVITCHWLGR